MGKDKNAKSFNPVQLKVAHFYTLIAQKTLCRFQGIVWGFEAGL